ncbi:MAG: DUF4372 domain-containing protein [Dysgonamonadaceae bacterium]|nr:DUF4372 domain-containing protein [Dysgonamonadaceae bacterium]
MNKCAKKCNSDYYVKRFKTRDHFTTVS